MGGVPAHDIRGRPSRTVIRNSLIPLDYFDRAHQRPAPDEPDLAHCHHTRNARTRNPKRQAIVPLRGTTLLPFDHLVHPGAMITRETRGSLLAGLSCCTMAAA